MQLGNAISAVAMIGIPLLERMRSVTDNVFITFDGKRK